MEENNPLEIFWKLVASFFLLLLAILGLIVIFLDLSNTWGVVGGALLFLGSILGLLRYIPHVVLFKSYGGFSYWLKLRLDRLGSGTVRVLSAAVVGGAAALLWKPALWLVAKMAFNLLPDAPDILFDLLAAFSNFIFALAVGGFTGWEYYKSRRHGSHLKLE